VWLVTVWSCDVIVVLHLAGTQLSKFGSQCGEVHSNRLVRPSDDAFLSSLHCPSCGTSTDRQTDTYAKVILSSCLLKVVYCVPSLTVSRHYTVHSAGYRVRRVGNEISCWLSVFWDVTQCGLVEIQLTL
jgi:hypothetical protein